MRLLRSQNRVKLIRESGDRALRNESDLFYQLRNLLLAEGEDVIKKEMAKDGHMVSDGIYYVRSRKIGRPGAFAIWDANYQIRDSREDFNSEGEVTLVLESMEKRGSRKDWDPRH